MKKMLKNAVISIAALTLGTSAFAEVNFDAYNKLTTDTVVINHNDDTNKDDNYFPGFKNRVNCEVTSDKFDAMVQADINIQRFKNADNNGDNVYWWGLSWDGLVKDWYVEIRPNNLITLGFHDNIFPEATVLPVYDDEENLSTGNIGSEGFTLVARPEWEGGSVRFAATVPFSSETNNYFYSEKYTNEDGEEVDSEKFNFGLGAILNMEQFELGFTCQDVADNDERVIGVYGTFPTLFGLSEASTLSAGYAHSEKAAGVEELTSFGGVTGKNLVNAVYTFEGEAATVTAEVLSNCKENESETPYDLYAGAKVEFGLTEQLSMGIKAKTLFDLSSKDDQNGVEAKPVVAGAAAVDFQLSEHSLFEVEADVDVCNGSYEVKFPLMWKYTF